MFKKQTKIYIIVFSVMSKFLLFKLMFVTFSITLVSAIGEQQYLEIPQLKSELKTALESDDENEDITTKGVIVQSSWTQSAGESESRQTSKLAEVNTQNHQEAAANYATGGNTKGKHIKEDMVEASVSIKNGSIIDLPHEEYTDSLPKGNPELKTNAPNIIQANIADDWEIDIRKLQRLELTKRRTREILILKYIEEDFSFDLGSEVHQWEHIIHGGQEYFIGRRLTDLLIVRKNLAKYEVYMMVDIGHPITYLETYTYWNLDQQHQESVILVATGDKVWWYRANQQTQQIELYWDWIIGYTITSLTHFTLDSKDYLIISSNQSSLADHYALNIYQYNLGTKEFWIAQRLQLKSPCVEVTVLNTGRDVILAIPQNNTAAIYTFNPHETAYSHIYFQLKKSVTSEGILTIVGFKMGGRSYLALTGYQPQILLYQQGDFVPKTILGNNFGLVELFFPIPVRTYRDDLILLVQHRVDFTTHSLTVLETLIWDGDAFETSIPVPCHMGQHVAYGVTCMLDLQRDEGLKGAALLRIEDNISIIVPRHKAESGLFRFHTELLAKNSELLDLQEMFSFLKEWVKEQDDLIAQAETFLQIPEEQLMKTHLDIANLESLRTPEFTFSGDVGEIYVNNYKWLPEDSDIDLETIIQNVEDLDKALNSGRLRRNLKNKYHENLGFNDILVEDMEVENVNGQPFFIQNGELDFEGTIEFNELEISNSLRDLEKRQTDSEDFVLEGDLEFDLINGVKWSFMKDNLVFRTQNQSFEELEVKGEVIVENTLSINTLNNLDFPDDFLLSTGPSLSIVKAEKNFPNTLSASSVDIDGFINGKNPEDAITLMNAQEWQGMPNFQHLEISGKLELHGRAQGSNIESQSHNPTLNESNTIEALCYFNELYVNGPIVLKGELDNQPLGSQLKDILLRSLDPTEEILVPSLKTFNMVLLPIDFQLENNTINQLPADDFVTVHTKQYLDIKSLEGYVYFFNLTLNGSYDGITVEEILRDVIFLDKPVDLSSSELVFSQELKANSIAIKDILNNITMKDNLQTIQEDLNLKSAEFENLQSQQADFSQDILGQGTLNNIELHEFVQDKSWHEPPIRGNVFLNELILVGGLQTDELHGIKAEFLLDFLNQINDLPDMVLNGQIQVDHITITGDVQLHKLNGQLFDEEIQLTTIWLNRPNYLSNKLVFKNRLNINGQLNVLANFRGDYLPDVIDDIVVRSLNSSIYISAPKSFLKSIKVLQNTQVKALNGVLIEHIGWRNKENKFKGSLHIKGNLSVQNLNIQGNINDFNWQDIQNIIYFDKNLQKFVLKNTIEFNQTLWLDDLTVLGDLNDVPKLSDFFDNLIFKNNLCLLKGKNTFTGRVTIDRGAYIKYLNGHDLMQLFNNLVFIHGSQPIVIKTPVQFENTVMANEVQVKKSLELWNLNDCSIMEWLNNTLRIDQDQYISHDVHFAAGCIDDNSLSVHFINDIDLNRVLTLSTPQTFKETVKFSNIYLEGTISSKGPVNNVDLEWEFNNTLMTYGHQHISTPLTIQSIIVLRDLLVKGLINNNKDLEDVATLQENIELKSPLFFQSIYSPQVIMKDMITGIEFDEWFAKALKYQDPKPQVITGNWSVKHLTIKNGPQDFQYMINGLEPSQYYSSMRSPRSNGDYNKEEICQLIKEIWYEIFNKSVYVKYIEEDFSIQLDHQQFRDLNETIRKVFYLKSHLDNLLVINFKCKSLIYKWLPQHNKFVYRHTYPSGPIDQIEVIASNNNSSELEFITIHYESIEEVNCTLKPINIWTAGNDSLSLKQTLPQDFGTLIYKSARNNNSLWSLHNETIKEYDLETYKIKHKWELPVEKNKTRYRFVSFKDDSEVILTNGEHIALLSNHLNKKSKKSNFYTQQPIPLQTLHSENFKNNNLESILKPNTSAVHSFVFAGFKQLIERILIDLGKRLNEQINITLLTIPESDLFDEHMVPDFEALMEELEKQNIYPSGIFNTSFGNRNITKNRAQILAARVVQLSWPVVLELEEIHSYLKLNTSHDHPLSSCISKTLCFFIKDILMMASEHNSLNDYNEVLKKVIERIRIFEKDLQNLINALEKHQQNEPAKVETLKKTLSETSSNKEFRAFSQAENKFVFRENSHLPGYKQGEILTLQVGSINNPRHLWAVINTKTSFISQSNPGIYIYLQNVQTQLYQVIAAVKPRSLEQLRVKRETLLVYIEDCCQVNILKYRGSQGFIKFSHIRSNEKIKQILTAELPDKPEEGLTKYLLILVMEKNMKFYEFIMEGWNYEMSQIPLDCMS